MDTSGTFPKLVGSDTVYTIKTYSEQMAAALGQDAPWTNLTVTNTTVFGTVSGYPLQCRRMGKYVQVRGMVLIKTLTGIAGATAVTVPAGMRPSSNQWGGATVSGNATAMPLIQSNGLVIPIVNGYYNGTLAAANAIAIAANYAID